MNSVLIRPRDVKRALWLLWGVASISALLSISGVGAAPYGDAIGDVMTDGIGLPSIEAAPSLLAFGARLYAGASFASRAFLISKAGSHRNWARVMLVIDFVIGVLGLMLSAALGGETVLSEALWLILFVTYGIAISLLYSMHASVWFKYEDAA